ncbi:MAG: sigma 54-interacting transcriptional regulator, partial [Candidatus Latescibacterota bacterium]
IHNASAFSEGPFLAVNCAAIPQDLIESELFGYVEGAFTGASRKGRLGKFELASGGTLFLDEIGDIPPEVQVKLLRVLQEKAVVRVGGDRTIPINCRLVAATNRDLHQAVTEHRFRRDLLYRLNVISLEVPPLRERAGDIRLFIDRFVRTFSERNGKVVDGVAEDVMGQLMEHEWPGNVRELENAIEHAVAMVKGRLLGFSDLPGYLRAALSGAPSEGSPVDGFESAQRHYQAAVRQLFLEALRVEHGDIPAAARRLGMSRATLYRRLRKLDLLLDVSRMRLACHG